MQEYLKKERTLRIFMKEKGLDGILLTRRESFSWFACGATNCIDRGSDYGFADIFVTSDKKYIISTNIEIDRIMAEEVEGQGYETLTYNWMEDRCSFLAKVMGNMKVGSDTGICGTTDVYNDLKPLRYSLLPEETKRLRELSRDSSLILKECCYSIKPGWTELQADGFITGRLMEKGIEAPVVLVGSDERIFKYRHPVSTSKVIDKYVMMVLCARKHGLVTALTRFVHFGKLPEEIKQRMKSVATVDAAFIINTRVGRKSSDVFKCGMAEYERQGYPQEWAKHYQGGPIGYGLREFDATEQTHDVVRNNQAFAWNPSVPGAKSEDTFLITDSGIEFLTEIEGWPSIEIEYAGQTIKRPDILVR